MHIIYTGATPIPAARVQRVDRVGALEDSLKRLVLQVSPEYLPSILTAGIRRWIPGPISGA